jgi:ABC-type multidrug transport system fused ATPase/permease subunit
MIASLLLGFALLRLVYLRDKLFIFLMIALSSLAVVVESSLILFISNAEYYSQQAFQLFLTICFILILLTVSKFLFLRSTALATAKVGSALLDQLFKIHLYLFQLASNLQQTSVKYGMLIQVNDAVGLLNNWIQLVTSTICFLLCLLFLFINSYQLAIFIVSVSLLYVLFVQFFVQRRISHLSGIVNEQTSRLVGITNEYVDSISQVSFSRNPEIFSRRLLLLDQAKRSNEAKAFAFANIPKHIIELIISIASFLFIFKTAFPNFFGFAVLDLEPKVLLASLYLTNRIVLFLNTTIYSSQLITASSSKASDIITLLQSSENSVSNSKRNILLLLLIKLRLYKTPTLKSSSSQSRLPAQLLESTTTKATSYPSNFALCDPQLFEYRASACINAIQYYYDLSIPRGCIVGIHGPSGSGKSFFLNSLLTLTGATIHHYSLFGTHFTQPTPSILREHISYVAQKPFLLNESLANILSMYAWPYDNYSLSNNDILFIERLLHIACFDSRFFSLLHSNQCCEPSEFSGGELYRIALASSLFQRRAVLLLDEPTSALDKFTEQKMIQRLLSFARDQRITVFMASHSSYVLDMCDELITTKSLTA